MSGDVQSDENWWLVQNATIRESLTYLCRNNSSHARDNISHQNHYPLECREQIIPTFAIAILTIRLYKIDDIKHISGESGLNSRPLPSTYRTPSVNPEKRTKWDMNFGKHFLSTYYGRYPSEKCWDCEGKPFFINMNIEWFSASTIWLIGEYSFKEINIVTHIGFRDPWRKK